MALKRSEQKRDGGDSYFEFAKVIINFIKENQHEHAEAYVDDLVKASKNTSCKAFHHSLIHACSKMGNPASAIWCALRMVRTGLKPNIVTFNALLDTAAKSGDTALALRLWDIIADIGLSPNSITYNTMMNVFAKAKNAQLAETWLRKMRADGMPMCAVSFQTVIAAYTKIGEYEKAEAWFNTMKQSGIRPDRAVYNSMIWAKSSHPGHVEHWLLEMEESGLVPDDKAYMTLVNLWSKNGQPEKALHWLRKMEGGSSKIGDKQALADTQAAMAAGFVGDDQNEIYARPALDKIVAKGAAQKYQNNHNQHRGLRASMTPCQGQEQYGFNSAYGANPGSMGPSAPAPVGKQATPMYVRTAVDTPYVTDMPCGLQANSNGAYPYPRELVGRNHWQSAPFQGRHLPVQPLVNGPRLADFEFQSL